LGNEKKVSLNITKEEIGKEGGQASGRGEQPMNGKEEKNQPGRKKPSPIGIGLKGGKIWDRKAVQPSPTRGNPRPISDCIFHLPISSRMGRGR